MDERPEPADVWRRDLSREELHALVADLEEHATVLDVLTKGGPLAHADPTPIALREAVLRLVRGEVRGVQIRYRFDGAEWRDTLMSTPAGVHDVRMRMPEPPPRGA